MNKKISEYLSLLPEDEREFAALKTRELSKLWLGKAVETCEEAREEMTTEYGVDRLVRALNCCKYIATHDSCGGHVYHKRNTAFCTGRSRFADRHCASTGYVRGYVRCVDGFDEEFSRFLREAARDLKHIEYTPPRCRKHWTEALFEIKARYLPGERKRRNALDFAKDMWTEFDILAQRVEAWVKERGLVDECFCSRPVSRLQELIEEAERELRGLRG
jgi:hypothetical protein